MTKFGEGGYKSMDGFYIESFGGHSSGNDFTDPSPPSIWLTLEQR